MKAGLFRRALLLAAVALLSLGGATGCATGLLYDRADRFAQRYVEGYLELEPAQRAWLEAQLRELHRWHRREQLPAYAGWLRAVAARLEEGESFSTGELAALGTELGALWTEFASQALPMLTELGAGLTDQQVMSLREALHAELHAATRLAARRSATAHQQHHARSMERYLRRFTGYLTPEQRVAVRAWTHRLEPSREASLANRAGWVAELETALARREDPEHLQEAAEVLFVAPARRWPPDYAALVARNAAATHAFLAEFLDQLEPRQRARAVQRLERLAADLARLAAVPG